LKFGGHYSTIKYNIIKDVVKEIAMLFEQIKKLIKQKLQKKIEDNEFIVQSRKFYKTLAILDVNKLTEEQVNLLTFFGRNYVNVFLDNSLSITCDDLDFIAFLAFNKFVPQTDMKTLNKLLFNITNDALELRLAKGDVSLCEHIIMRHNVLFDMQPSATRKELNDYLKTYLTRMIDKKFLRAAHDFFTNKIKGNLSESKLNDLFCEIFFQTVHSQDIKYLEQIVATFNLNFKNYLSKHIDANNKIVGLSIISAVCLLKSKDSKEQYLSFLKKNNIDIDADQYSVNFYNKMKGMTALLNASNQGDLELVELLVKYGADINQLIPCKNNFGDTISFRTPFSVSFGTGNIEFVKSLVFRCGANPLIAMINCKQLMLSYSLPINLETIPTMGAGELSEKIGKEEYEKYASAYYEIIENYFLNQLLKRDLQTTEVSTKKPAMIENNYYSTTVDEQSITIDSSPFSETNLDTLSISSVSPIIHEKLFDDYIDFKKVISQKTKKSLENEFDILLLEYLKDHLEENLQKLHAFIKENPEIEFYSIRSILNNIDNIEDVQCILSDPCILHKFFKLKKQNSNSLLNNVKESIKLPDGFYKIQSNLKNAVYAAVSTEIGSKLDYSNSHLLQKFIDQLKKGCKFIKANSEHESGIKRIKGTIKLKLANEDYSIAAEIKYLHEPSLITLIVFDKIIDHNYLYPCKDIQTIGIVDFSEISSIVVKYDSVQVDLRTTPKLRLL
jgi:hypothetical protein